MQSRTLLLAAMLCASVGCQKDAPVTEVSEVPVQAASRTSPAPAQHAGGSTKGLIKADRESLSSCESTKILVSWDISSLAPKINDVQVFANGSLFAAGGSVGSQLTDQWVVPGTVFVMKAAGDDSELDTLTIGGPICN